MKCSGFTEFESILYADTLVVFPFSRVSKLKNKPRLPNINCFASISRATALSRNYGKEHCLQSLGSPWGWGGVQRDSPVSATLTQQQQHLSPHLLPLLRTLLKVVTRGRGIFKIYIFHLLKYFIFLPKPKINSN